MQLPRAMLIVAVPDVLLNALSLQLIVPEKSRQTWVACTAKGE